MAIRGASHAVIAAIRRDGGRRDGRDAQAMDSGLAGLGRRRDGAEPQRRRAAASCGCAATPCAELVADFGYDGAVGLLVGGLCRRRARAARRCARNSAPARAGGLRAPRRLARRRRGSRPLVEGVRLALAALPDDGPPAAILATLPVAIGAAAARARRARRRSRPTRRCGTAADLLRMVHGASGRRPAMAEALDTYWTALIDNGLNTSAFTARVIASSRASLASAALGAYCAFTGPLHGGAPGPTLDMLDEAEASGDVAAWAETQARGRRAADGLWPSRLQARRPARR